MLTPWKKSYYKARWYIKKQRHHSVDKVPYSQGYGIPSGHVWLRELDHKEGRAPKNWCFQTVVLEKTPECPLDSKEIKPVNLKEINPEYSVEGLLLKFQYFGHLMRRANSLDKTLVLGKIEGRRGRGDRGWDGWIASLTRWTWVWANFGRLVKDREAWQSCATVHGVTKSWTWLSNWTTNKLYCQ